MKLLNSIIIKYANFSAVQEERQSYRDTLVVTESNSNNDNPQIPSWNNSNTVLPQATIFPSINSFTFESSEIKEEFHHHYENEEIERPSIIHFLETAELQMNIVIIFYSNFWEYNKIFLRVR